jgi:hypothetical protein
MLIQHLLKALGQASVLAVQRVCELAIRTDRYGTVALGPGP